MELHTLTPAKGSIKKRKRIGRGQGSGKGGTSTKGHKGQQSRSGSKRRNYFEGGQMCLQRRVPKFGFKSLNPKNYQVINLDALQKIASKLKINTIDREVLYNNSLIGKGLYKILASGKENLKDKLTVYACAFSKSAKKTIEAMGGSAIKK